MQKQNISVTFNRNVREKKDPQTHAFLQVALVLPKSPDDGRLKAIHASPWRERHEAKDLVYGIATNVVVNEFYLNHDEVAAIGRVWGQGRYCE